MLAATYRGTLILAFVHPAPLVGRAPAVRIAAGMVQRLEGAARPGA